MNEMSFFANEILSIITENIECKVKKKHCCYLGYVGGSLQSDSGAAVEPLCLPRTPEWGNYRDGRDGNKAKIYGAEYETGDLSGKWHRLNEHDVLCGVHVCSVR